MYNILVCDDRGYCREFIKAELQSFFDSKGENFSVTEYSSGDDVLFHLKPGFYDIAIFDVEMDGTNGIDTARRFRGIDKNVIIIFATAHPESVFASFTAEPLTFLTKPLKSSDVQDALSRALLQVMSSRKRKFIYESNKVSNVLPVRDILYFESRGRMVDAVTVSGKSSFYGKLDDVQSDPSLSGFLRSHQSFLINPDFIMEITASTVVLTDNVVLPIRRGSNRELRSQFMDYLASLEK